MVVGLAGVLTVRIAIMIGQSANKKAHFPVRPLRQVMLIAQIRG